MIKTLQHKILENKEYYLTNWFFISLLFYQKLSVILIILLFIIWIFQNNFIEKWNTFKEYKALWILPLLYIFYILGMLYSKDLIYGFSKLETKFGLFLLPFLLTTLPTLNNSDNRENIKKNYVLFSIISAVICYINATYNFLYELYCREHRIILDEYPYTNYFFTSYLSIFFHYGYYAMYVNVAIMLSYDLFLRNKINPSWFVFCLLFLSIFVLMLGSKAGIITLFIIHCYYGIIFLFKNKSLIKWFFYIFLMILSLGTILFFVIPNTNNRIKIVSDIIISKKRDSTSVESTQLRYYAWKASYNLIRSNPLMGYGTGDVNNVLIHEYKIKNYLGPLKKELNAHNQFLQTALSVGIMGSIILIVFFVWMIYLGLKHNNPNLVLFAIVTFIAFLFESYLETQAGVFYTVIFSSLFFKESISK